MTSTENLCNTQVHNIQVVPKVSFVFVSMNVWQLKFIKKAFYAFLVTFRGQFFGKNCLSWLYVFGSDRWWGDLLLCD